jgi:hypothetical protein
LIKTGALLVAHEKTKKKKSPQPQSFRKTLIKTGALLVAHEKTKKKKSPPSRIRTGDLEHHYGCLSVTAEPLSSKSFGQIKRSSTAERSKPLN